MGEASVCSQVVLEEEEEEVEEEMIVRWENLIPQMSLGVLLVEGDDSTRHIISALLRKCNYKAVAAVADGLKAWEMLKEKPKSFDLVLAEVDLPSVSGFSLLSMIMSHDICKNMPVIMMSSHDSVSMVFKCMLRGAADFLVKPIRKNELRNLWQHVWRRQASNGFHHVQQDGKRTQLKFNTTENNAASNHSSACMQKNRECSEKGSDAQSSCSKPDTEAESEYVQNGQEILQPKDGEASLGIDTAVLNHEKHYKFSGSLLICESEDEGKSKRLDLEVAPSIETTNPNESLELEPSPDGVLPRDNEMALPRSRVDANVVNENGNRDRLGKHSREAIDFFRAINNQLQSSYQCVDSNTSCGNIFGGSKKLSDANGNTCQRKSSTGGDKNPMIQRYEQHWRRLKPNETLSLRASVSTEPPDSKTSKGILVPVLDLHFPDSAYGSYVQPSSHLLLSPSHISLEPQECYRNSQKRLTNLSSGNVSGIQCHRSTHKNNHEETEFQFTGHPQKTTFSRVEVVPVPVPVPARSMSIDGFYAGYGTLLSPVFYPQARPPGPPPWSASSSNQKDASHVNSFHQPNPETDDLDKKHHHCDQVADKSICKSVSEVEPNLEPEQELRQSVPISGQSESSNVCHGSRSHINSSGCGSICNESSMNGAAIAAGGGGTSESGNDESFPMHGNKVMKDYQCISQREAALNKFRLKRKDRCYEKKVRYQSRKRLAEQRPRVKGQFVRQVQLDPCPPPA
ncbi:hypothetical protein ACLOJK_004459 [Asimina triloba]